MGDAFLLLNFSICCKASNVVMFLKENVLVGVSTSFFFLILGCLLYFIITISIGSSIVGFIVPIGLDASEKTL